MPGVILLAQESLELAQSVGNTRRPLHCVDIEVSAEKGDMTLKLCSANLSLQGLRDLFEIHKSSVFAKSLVDWVVDGLGVFEKRSRFPAVQKCVMDGCPDCLSH